MEQKDTNMSALEQRIQHIEDDSAIRELVARFADTTTRADHDAFSNLWVPQSTNKPTWTLSKPFAMSATGIHEIMDMIRKLRDTRDFFVQLVHTGVLDIKGDRATGRWIMHEVAKGPGEVYYNNYSQYEDAMEKHGGKWYFAKRDYKYMFRDSESFTGNVFQAPVAAAK